MFRPGTVYVFRQDPSLPVTPTSFSASKVKNRTLLQWATAAETNSSHFEIQKSLNAKDWTAVAHVEAAKESNAVRHYTHWDNLRAEGNVYYRLKMVDADGSFTYSGIRNLFGEQGIGLVAFPNPVTDRIFIKTADYNRIVAVRLRNVAGQFVYESNGSDGEGIARTNWPLARASSRSGMRTEWWQTGILPSADKEVAALTADEFIKPLIRKFS